MSTMGILNTYANYSNLNEPTACLLRLGHRPVRHDGIPLKEQLLLTFQGTFFLHRAKYIQN